LAFRVYRSSFNYWLNRQILINPEHVKQLAVAKYIHELSNGSAGARTVAKITAPLQTMEEIWSLFKDKSK
jgi:hypothetical protein